MFFIVSKLLAYVDAPIVWIFIVFLFALFAKDPLRKRKFILWTFILFYLFSNCFIFDKCMHAWEIPAMSYDAIKEPYDAGIVLGGVISYDQTLDRFQFQRQADRVLQAVLLYRKGKIKKILFSGGAGALDEPENKEGPHVKSFLLSIGIPESDILIEGESRNTWQNATLTKELLDKNFKNGRYLLVTTASHQRRAIMCFERAGVQVTPFSVDRYSGPGKYNFEYLFIPNANALFKWEALTHELIGIMIYKVMGYA